MLEKTTYQCGWYGTIGIFLSIPDPLLIQNLTAHHLQTMLENPSTSQITAWTNSFKVLRETFNSLTQFNQHSRQWTIIFEYELPRERGRRPDVVILADTNIFVLEFKDFANILQAHVDQVAAYSRDLQHYQSASHNNPIYPLLVLTKARGISVPKGAVSVVSPNYLEEKIFELNQKQDGPTLNPETWLNAEYAPLPSLITVLST